MIRRGSRASSQQHPGRRSLWARGRYETSRLLFTWAVVFVGNCVGAISTAILMFFQVSIRSARRLGLNALQDGSGQGVPATSFKLRSGTAVQHLGVPGCVDVMQRQDDHRRIVTIVTARPRPLSLRVSSTALPMFILFPFALLIKAGAPASFWSMLGRTASDFETLTWPAFLVNNLLPVTSATWWAVPAWLVLSIGSSYLRPTEKYTVRHRPVLGSRLRAHDWITRLRSAHRHNCMRHNVAAGSSVARQ